MRCLRIEFACACLIGLTCIACGSDEGASGEQAVAYSTLVRDVSEVVPAVAMELTPLGKIDLDELRAIGEAARPTEPPYERQESTRSRHLRDLSLRAQAMEAADPDRFYVMRIDVQTGDVFAVARSNEAAASRANRLAPGGIAPPLNSRGDSFAEKAALSDLTDNRANIKSSAFDTIFYVHTAGQLITGGGCSGSLFANQTVVTAAHCVIGSGGPGATTIQFSPRQRSSTDKIRSSLL